jgi:hypothetical protein
MKRGILVLCFALLLSAFAISASANEAPDTWDSLNIPEEETVDFVKEHDGVDIYERYAFDARSEYGNAYVYYVTNRGNYIYYHSYAQPNAYLVPETLVCELIRVHQNHLNTYHADIGGKICFEESVDLSAYCVRGFEEVAVHQHDPSELKNEDEIPRRTEPFFPTAAVIAAAVSLAVLGGVTLAAWMYQKKTKR